MSKKKIEIPLRAGSDVPSGDVNISYKGSRIAGLSESSAAVLKTENTIVEGDIEVEYTKTATVATRDLSVTIPEDYGDVMFNGAILAGNIATTNKTISESGTIPLYVANAETTVLTVWNGRDLDTHPANITGSCVINYAAFTGRLAINTNASTFAISIITG